MSEVRGERIGDVAVLTIDGPATRNALAATTFAALCTHLDAAALDRTVRAVVLTGAGEAFVSGGDLRELRDLGSAEDAARLCDAGREVTSRIAALPVPVIAALAGPAIGGGAELAVACDLRVAAASARIGFKHARMGVTTAWGTLPRLCALVGAGAAARLLFTAQELPADEARALGLVDAVVPAGAALDGALEWARDVTLGSPEAVAKAKLLLRGAEEDRALADAERTAFLATWSAEDHAEAMRAFFARRTPSWAARRV